MRRVGDRRVWARRNAGDEQRIVGLVIGELEALPTTPLVLRSRPPSTCTPRHTRVTQQKQQQPEVNGNELGVEEEFEVSHVDLPQVQLVSLRKRHCQVVHGLIANP